MKKSELIARYMHFNEDITAIEAKDFFNVLHHNKIDLIKTKPENDTDSVMFSINGWDYYSYYSIYKIGLEVKADTFQFKIKRATIEDRESMRAMFSRRNDYTVFEEVAIGGEDFSFDCPDLVAL